MQIQMLKGATENSKRLIQWLEIGRPTVNRQYFERAVATNLFRLTHVLGLQGFTMLSRTVTSRTCSLEWPQMQKVHL